MGARDVIDLGLIDTPEKALEAGHACRERDIDLLLISYGPAHHCEVGIGHAAEQLRKIAALLHLGFSQVV